MYSGPTTPPPPSSPQVRRYDPQRPGGGRSSAPVEFEGALIDPEQTSALGDVGSGRRRLLEHPNHHRTNPHPDEMHEQHGGALTVAEPALLPPPEATGRAMVESDDPLAQMDISPAADARPLAVEARLQIARERAQPTFPVVADMDTSATAQSMAERLHSRIVQMIGLPDDRRHPGLHITA